MEPIKIFVVLLFVLGPICYLLAIIGLFKPKFVIRRPSLQTRAGAFFLWAIAGSCFYIGGIIIASVAADKISSGMPAESRQYYVGAKGANLRECPSASCEIIDTLPKNTKLAFPGDLYDKYPDWVEVTFPDGKLGYVSKTVLSKNSVSESRQAPAGDPGDPSSVGGIVIGPWANIQTTAGESYEFHFCEPESAISGAPCGRLADTATNPTGGRPPYSFFKKSGFLPPGMVLELNGTFSGSPTQAGTYNFRLCAKDLYGGEGCQNLAVAVKEESEYSTYVPDYPQENLTKSATIDEFVCNWTKVGEEWSFGHLDDRRVWNGHAAGTATGPVGTDFWLSEGYPPGGSISCGDWNADYENLYCVRGPGQPAQTNWYAIWRSQEILFDHMPPSSSTFRVKGLTERTENCSIN